MPNINAKAGDLVEVFYENKKIKGVVMPSEKDKIILKLDSGYNLTIKKNNIEKIKLIEKYREPKLVKEKIKLDPSKPTISILHTGGTISSKVDYRTGAVTSRFSPEEILEMFPELKTLANIKSKLVFQMFSEDIEPEHWTILAKEIEKEIKSGVDGIIITHGTDTMSYTSAALSFMLQNSPIPIILVGSQRSSDRPSSDSFLNLICAANFIINSNFSGIGVCMHANMQDDYCYIHSGVRVRKLHTSRRDAFKSVNTDPIAKVWKNKIEIIRKDYAVKDKKRKLSSKICFNKNISILKSRPGLTSKEVNFFKKYDGIVLEGTGLGHFPVNVIDKYTKEHKKILDSIKSICKKSLVVMASQTIFGRVNMNVYSTGRDLQEVGVIPAEDMLAEVAYVKLGWILAQTKNLKKAREMFLENYAGEITKRILIEEDFLE